MLYGVDNAIFISHSRIGFELIRLLRMDRLREAMAIYYVKVFFGSPFLHVTNMLKDSPVLDTI